MTGTPVALLLSVILVAGCGLTAAQKQDVSQFGKATEALGGVAEEQLVQLRSEANDMNLSQLTLDTGRPEARPRIDEPLHSASIQPRVAAARALKSYGSLLNQLATADHAEGIRQAAQDVVSNFDTALGTGMKQEDRDAVAAIVLELGNLWIERKKQDALKRIVLTYREPVARLADLLAADLTRHESGDQAGVVDLYDLAAGQLENRAIGALGTGDFARRSYAVNAYASAARAKLKVAELSARAYAAHDDFRKAHAALVLVLTEEVYGTADVKAFAKSVQELVNNVKVLAK